MARPDGLAGNRRRNALVGWVFAGVVALVAVESLLTDAVLWGGFALLFVAVAVLPAVRSGDRAVMVPWPHLAVASVAMIVREFGLYPETAGYVAVTMLALLVVVELDAFTPVEMSRRFAVGFTVLTTMAIQGLWTVAQYYSDFWLGTEFLRSQTELQWDFVIVTAVAIVLGVIFERYLPGPGEFGADEQSPK